MAADCWCSVFSSLYASLLYRCFSYISFCANSFSCHIDMLVFATNFSHSLWKGIFLFSNLKYGRIWTRSATWPLDILPARPVLWIRITLMRIRIRIITIRIMIFNDADPDPTFHPDADPDRDPDPSFQERPRWLEKWAHYIWRIFARLLFAN